MSFLQLSHINTENFNQQEVQNQLNQIITNDFDKEQVLTELGAQVTITTEFDNERRAVRSEFTKKAEGYRKEAKQAREQGNTTLAKDLEGKAQHIEQNLRLFDGITSALYAPNSNGIIGDVARAASPELAYQIGQHFKENKFKNEIDGGNRPEEQSANHLLAHAILGAAVSYATGNNPTTGALSGAGSEVAAPALANYLYGTKDPSELTQEQKDTITSILSLAIAATTYGATGDVGSALSAGEVGKVGIEGNAYVPLSAMQGKSRSEVKRLYDSNISYFNANCIQTSANCNSIVDNMIKFADSGYVALNYPDLRDRTIILLRDNPAVLERYFNNKVAQFNAKDRSILNMYLLPALEVAGGVAGAGGSIAGTTYACAQTAGFGCYAAAVAGSAGFTSSVDHIVTGSGNIGRPLSQQDPTAFVKFLKSQGLSEATATNLQLAIDVFGTGGIGVSVGSSTKGVGTSAQAVKQAKSQVTATPKATQTKATCSNGTVCFTAGTLIETSEGLKAVETFTGGELIWSRNDITLEYGYHPVIATKATPDQPIFQVTVKNNQGDIETLETTAEHPFWIKETGWLKASLLEQGMILLDRNNQEVEVLSQYLIPNHTDTVYNIEVDNFHTYHVGRLGVWVHNAQCCDLNVGIWGKGSYNDSMASLQAHFNKHGAEVGAETIEQYLRKAEAFKQNLRGATKSPVAGETNGVIRYKKNGKYIVIAPDGSIISFGKQ